MTLHSAVDRLPAVQPILSYHFRAAPDQHVSPRTLVTAQVMPIVAGETLQGSAGTGSANPNIADFLNAAAEPNGVLEFVSGCHISLSV
jgi:hypothetical protein